MDKHAHVNSRLMARDAGEEWHLDPVEVGCASRRSVGEESMGILESLHDDSLNKTL